MNLYNIKDKSEQVSFAQAVRQGASALGDRGEGQVGTHGHGRRHAKQQG